MTDAAAQPHGRETTFLWWAIIATSIAIPLTVVPSAKDAFRVPKELEFRALGIIIIATVIGSGWKRFADSKWRKELMIAGLGCAWVAITTVFSVNRTLSVQALLTVIFTAAIFLAACVSAQERSPASLLLLFAPAIVNAAIMISQATGAWSPFRDESIETALIGNRNDAGAYLLSPAIAGFVLAGVTKGRQRLTYGIIAVGLLAGLLATQTLSAIIGYFGALAAFAVIAKRELLKPVALAVIIVATASGLALVPRDSAVKRMLTRVKSKVSALASGNIDVAMTSRLAPFLAAWEMFADRPIVGVGPGAFHFEYFSQRLEVERRHPTLLSPYAERSNFGEVHNDHLQILAETGLVGYLIFAGAGLYIASFSFRRVADNERDSDRALIARHLAFPLVCGFAVLAIGQFPIQLAAPRLTFLFFAAICCAWSRG